MSDESVDIEAKPGTAFYLIGQREKGGQFTVISHLALNNYVYWATFFKEKVKHIII